MIADINVTPLVDVVLVLLVIFMVAAPVLYQSAIKVKLPSAATGKEQTQKSPLQFTLTKDETLMWGKDKINWTELSERLKAMGATVSTQTAIISADQATPHGTVVKLMDSLRQAGLTKFALNVDSR